jgi:hypothetical protein
LFRSDSYPEPRGLFMTCIKVSNRGTDL